MDRAVIQVIAGRGGDGCLGFRRAKYIPKGGPDGGDGGHGGSVFFETVNDVDTLLDMAGKHHWKAEPGQPGGGKSCHGRNGADLIVRVPPGTQVFDDETGELIVDLDQAGMRFAIARGGRGGLGNERFKSSTNQTPQYCTPGEPGESRMLRLELKLIADVGLVGKPNAGKSTLLSRCSAARPKIGNYPFTTLEPQLGIAELTNHRRLVIADIPGLIEGAHQGAGLGLDFLRHIERTRLLVHLLDPQPDDGSDPAANYRAIHHELAEYSTALAEKTELIVLNKADILGEEAETQVAELSEALGRPVFLISAVTGDGVRPLLEACWAALRSPVGDE